MVVGIASISCDSSEKNEDAHVNSQPSKPVALHLDLQRDQEICQSPMVINASIEWGEGYTNPDCIDIQNIKFGCVENAPHTADAGDEQSGSGIDLGVDTDLPKYDYGCDLGVTRSILVKKGSEVIYQESAIDAPIIHKLAPPYSFCVNDGKIDIVMTLEAAASVENGEDLIINYMFRKHQGDQNPSSFVEALDYIVSEEGCFLFPWQNQRW